MSKKLKIEELDFDEGSYVNIPTFELFEEWVKKGNWDDLVDFYESTGIDPRGLLNKWFTVIHNSVYYI